MFRYIGLTWDARQPATENLANRLGSAMRGASDWQIACQRPGLQVCVTGGAPRANGVCTLDGHRGVVLGTLFRRDRLEPVSDALDSQTTARIIKSGGQLLVDEHWGRYIAFLATPAGSTIVLRDPSGTLPCFLIQHGGIWIVFSWLEDILTLLPDVPLATVSWDAVGAHLRLGEIGGHATTLTGIDQLLPGQAIELLGHDATRTLRWNAVETARSPLTIHTADAAAMLRETVQTCARTWAACYDRLVLRLSGGVDSSILLSCLSEGGTAAQVTCLNYHFAGADGDERSYARLASTRSRHELIELECDGDFELLRIIDAAPTPTPSGYMGRMGTARMDAVVAADLGAAALFTGGGGDQLFYEFRQAWPAADYLRLRGLDAGVLPAVMDAARLGRVSFWRALRLAVSERMHPTRYAPELGNHFKLLVREALPDAKPSERFVHPALCGPIELPLGKLMQTQQLMVPLGYYDPFERGAAPELVNPLLSQPLVELALRLPTYVLAHGGQGRALARQAFSKALPPQIATRRSKGGMDDFVKRILLRNLGFARAMLLDGHLMRRGYLDRPKVEAALSDRPTTLASPISELHILIGIEAWLQGWLSRLR